MFDHMERSIRWLAICVSGVSLLGCGVLELGEAPTASTTRAPPKASAALPAAITATL